MWQFVRLLEGMMRNRLPMILIRVIVGLVFLTEGILKFLHPGELGSGRFAHIGLPLPYITAPLVGAIEIAAGAAVILNLYAGDAAILLLLVIITALITTKDPYTARPAPWALRAAEARALWIAEFPARGADGLEHAVWAGGYSARQWRTDGAQEAVKHRCWLFFRARH